jgi:hypothetical protein
MISEFIIFFLKGVGFHAFETSCVKISANDHWNMLFGVKFFIANLTFKIEVFLQFGYESFIKLGLMQRLLHLKSENERKT